MSFSEIKSDFIEYLKTTSKYSQKYRDVKASDVNIFSFADEIKDFISKKFNVDSSKVFSMSLSDISNLTVQNGNLILESAENDKEIIGNSEKESIFTESENNSVDSNINNDDEEISDIIDKTSEELSSDEAAEKPEDVKDDKNNLFKWLIGDMLENNLIKNSFDENQDGIIDEDETKNFLSLIGNLDGNDSDVSLYDILAMSDLVNFLSSENSAASETTEDTKETEETKDKEDTKDAEEAKKSSGSSGGGGSVGGGSYAPSGSSYDSTGATGNQESSDVTTKNVDSMTLDELNSYKSEVESSISTLESEVSEKENNVNSAKEDISKAKEESDKEINNAQEDFNKKDEEYKNAIREHSKEKGDKWDKLAKFLDEVSKSEQKQTEALSGLSEAINNEAQCQQNVNTCQTNVINCQSALNQAQANLDKIKAQASASENEGKDFSSEIAAAEKEVAAKQEALEKANTELSNAKEELGHSQENVTKAQENYNNATKELEELNEQRENTESEIYKAEQEFRKENEELSKQYDTAKENLDKSKETQKTNIDNAQANFKTAQEALETSQAGLKEKVDELGKVNTKITEKENSKTDLFDPNVKFDMQYIKDGNMPYLLIGPSDVKEGEELPVLVYLHGTGERGTSASALKGGYCPAGFMNGTALQNFRGYIICPQITDKSSNWNNATAEKNLRNVINNFKSTHNVDDKKIALVGGSMGGSGTVYLAGRMGDVFCKAAAISAFGSKISPSEVSIPLKGFYGASDERGAVSYMKKNFSDLTVVNGKHGQVPANVFKEYGEDLIKWLYSA